MKKVKRWETYEGDFAKAVEDHSKQECVTFRCSFGGTCRLCFCNWLMEEVEAEE